MQHRCLDRGKETTYIIVFDEGDEFTAGMQQFASEQNLTAASFTAIGALQDATLGWFDMERRDYFENHIHEQVEVLSLIGNVADHNGKPKVHAHVVLGKKDASAIGGHLLSGHVRPTLEVTLTESPADLHRLHDEKTGLALIRPQAK
jgi:predicted DNA-binding protein with PD1-like motif